MTTSRIELPDIDEMMKVVDEIYSLSLRKTALEVDLKFAETLVSKEAGINPKYFKTDNKPQTQAYVKDTWLYGGFEGELIPRRKELGEVTARVEFLKSKLDLMKELIGIWRTQSASERTSVM